MDPWLTSIRSYNWIKSLLKDYKEVATTTVTVANGYILPAAGVGNISFETEHG
jgi:hypothetical protein